MGKSEKRNSLRRSLHRFLTFWLSAWSFLCRVVSTTFKWIGAYVGIGVGVESPYDSPMEAVRGDGRPPTVPVAGNSANSSNGYVRGDYIREWERQFKRFVQVVRVNRILSAKTLPINAGSADAIEEILDLPDSHKAKIALLNRLSKVDRAESYKVIAREFDDDAGPVRYDPDIYDLITHGIDGEPKIGGDV